MCTTTTTDTSAESETIEKESDNELERESKNHTKIKIESEKIRPVGRSRMAEGGSLTQDRYQCVLCSAEKKLLHNNKPSWKAIN